MKETKRRGGRPRSKHKQSYTRKFLTINHAHFPHDGQGGDWKKIKEVR